MKYASICHNIFNNFIKTSSRETFRSIVLGAASGEDIKVITALCKNNNKNYYFYAIEANPIWIDSLKKLENTEVINAAVTETNNRIVSFYINENIKYGGTAIASSTNKKIKVKNIKLSNLIKYLNYVELVSMDIQASEVLVIEESIKQLNTNILYLHILTHSNDIEEKLYKLLISNNWKNIVNIPKKNKLYNNNYDDGLQIWINNNFK